MFEVSLPYPRYYAIRELHNVHVVRGSRDLLTIIMACLAAVLGVGLAVTLPFLHSSRAWLAALVVVVAPALVGGACWRLKPPQYELHATYQGRLVQLFRTTDAQTFGQVKRALMRAIEASEHW
ncbi:MAG: hypothetical protein AUI14_18485 [Actinobacteria bacterium 13_2_20CM_2_71_6]|nr:MAG: hypothetical protein AUI14_18485 [Actinobacteria bacterium 13_2_20CM_2_71_6]